MKTAGDCVPLNLFALREAYLKKTVSVTEVVQGLLNRIAAFKAHNVWISLQAPDVLLAQARALELQDPAGLPLYGVPFAVKDNIDVAGLPTTAACPGFSYVPSVHAKSVQLLVDAGALVVGKTNMDQFATGLTGTRSPEPYGICKNAFNPDYISGGSSSGSAVAVALSLVSFALGTDTAGSGRVPAAFNNITGLKPTRGLISCSGVVPACRSLDCVSVFSMTAGEAHYLLNILQVKDDKDCYARIDRSLPAGSLSAGQKLRFGVPKAAQLEFFGDAEGAGLFGQMLEKLGRLGELVEIDFQPFKEAAALLYDGPWVAERYAGLSGFIEDHPEELHPVIKQIFSGAHGKTAADTFKAMHRLQALRQEAEKLIQGLACIVVPTAPRIYRIEEVLANPVRLNTNLGYYTNFMNLLDLSAVAVPAGFAANGLPFGVTLFAEALADIRLLALASELENGQDGGSFSRSVLTRDNGNPNRYRRIAVCGAHMQGLALNRQLQDLGAKFASVGKTSGSYRLFLLSASLPERPGLVRDEYNGQSIELELWDLPAENWADFIANIKTPLCIGSVELDNGQWEYGFLCEHYPLVNALEITSFGGWRHFLNSKLKS